jgi:hypothetical protein
VSSRLTLGARVARKNRGAVRVTLCEVISSGAQPLEWRQFGVLHLPERLWRLLERALHYGLPLAGHGLVLAGSYYEKERATDRVSTGESAVVDALPHRP